MKILTHLLALYVAGILAVGAAFAHGQPGHDRDDAKREGARNFRAESFKRNDMPRWLPKDDHKQIERIIEEFARGDLHRAESRWASLIRRQPFASRPQDARRLADYIYLSVRDGSHEKRIRLEDKVTRYSCRARTSTPALAKRAKAVTCKTFMAIVYRP